jgi:hypothetical protein
MSSAMEKANSRDTVRSYLRVLSEDEATPLFWTTFDDKRRRLDLGFTDNAPLRLVEPRLRRMNAEGAGVFICLGRICGSERLKQNVQSVGVLVLDLDGALLPPTFGDMPPLHLIVETSPARWHCYWMVDSIPLEAFEILQRKLAIQFNGDRSVSFLEQIIRVPGFIHHKKQPFLPRIALDQVDAGHCSFIEVASALKGIDLMSMETKGPMWIRDRSTGAIIDHRFLSYVVWSEVLQLETDDPAEIADRAWRYCEDRVDVARLGLRCTLELAHLIARSAKRTITAD